MSMLPSSRPQAPRKTVEAAAALAIESLPTVYVVGVRGYYFDTMGAKGKNDVGLYDDALFILAPGIFRGFNANTDPSKQTPGIATLIPGVYPYRPGNHGISRPGGGYPAFRPATKDEALPVTRSGQRGTSEGIAINIHKGGYGTTSSAGCQTIHPDQWPEFQSLLMRELAKAGLKKFDYILVEGPIN